MESNRLLLASMVRLKALRLNSDLEKDYEDYCFKFNKIMTALDENELSIPRRLEDILFDAGLPEGSKWFRNAQFLPGGGKNRDRNMKGPLKRSFPSENDVDFLDFHKANGHASLQVLKKKADKLGLRIMNVDECRTCTEHAFMLEFVNARKPDTRSLSILEIFHFHLSSEFPVVGFTGVTRFLLIIDDYSKMMFIYTVQRQEEIMKILFKFLSHCGQFRENATRTIITDDLPEFNNEAVQLYLRKRNIHQELIPTNKKNAFADFYAKTIQVMLKFQMYDSEGIDPSLWSESIKSAAYVYNNLPNEALNWSTPSDIWLDKTLVMPDKFFPFGKWFMASFPNQTIKLKKCRFVGYHPHACDLYRFYCPRDETIGFGQAAYELFEKETKDPNNNNSSSSRDVKERRFTERKDRSSPEKRSSREKGSH